MKYNNGLLQEKLKLARGCLRSGRCPGDWREKDFFHHFDLEAAAAAEAQQLQDAEWRAGVAAEISEASLHIPQLATFEPGRLGAASAQVARLRRDVTRLERFYQERSQVLAQDRSQFSQEVFEHCKTQDALADVRAEVQRLRKSLAEARLMSSRQEREIKDLEALAAAAEAEKEASPKLKPKPTPRPRALVSASRTAVLDSAAAKGQAGGAESQASDAVGETHRQPLSPRGPNWLPAAAFSRGEVVSQEVPQRFWLEPEGSQKCRPASLPPPPKHKAWETYVAVRQSRIPGFKLQAMAKSPLFAGSEQPQEIASPFALGSDQDPVSPNVTAS